MQKVENKLSHEFFADKGDLKLVSKKDNGNGLKLLDNDKLSSLFNNPPHFEKKI